jgi:alpha/beta superfamily hydrolase
MLYLKRLFLWVVVPLLIAYAIICSFLYFAQEKIIFRPHKLVQDYQFQFEQPFEEINIPSINGYSLNALHFPSDSAKGVVLFFHGNGGAIDGWGQVNAYYTKLGYDVIIADYKGYGKNKGPYSSLQQFLNDAQSVYDFALTQYQPSQIVLVGYSLGTGAASYVASKNQPKQLILLSPYYSLKDLMQKSYPFVPTYVLKYNIKTYQYVDETKVPITIFQGDADNKEFLASSLKLEEHLKPSDEYILLKGQAHNGVHENEKFQAKLAELLSN